MTTEGISSITAQGTKPRATVLALRVAVAWGYVTPDEIAGPNDRFDHSAAMLFRMIHPRR